MIDQIRREIGRHMAGVRSAFRAVQTGLGITTKIQRASAEGLSSEALNEMELFQQFGFTSAPPEQTELIVIPLGGRTSAAIVVATEHGTYRFKLDAQGEAALYNQWGDVVHMRQDRKIYMKAAAEVIVDAPLATFTGNVQVDGDVHVDGTATADVDVIGGGVHLKTHMHGGVLTGGDLTGEPA
jgi:phage baseplate assembly protein V